MIGLLDDDLLDIIGIQMDECAVAKIIGRSGEGIERIAIDDIEGRIVAHHGEDTLCTWGIFANSQRGFLLWLGDVDDGTRWNESKIAEVELPFFTLAGSNFVVDIHVGDFFEEVIDTDGVSWGDGGFLEAPLTLLPMALDGAVGGFDLE